MPSPEQIQRELARLQKEAADLRKKLSDAQTEAAKASASAGDKRVRASRTSSPSMAGSYLRDAERLEKKAADLQRRAADASKKLADNATKQAGKVKDLDSATHEAQRKQDREANRRQQGEKQHAREVARLSRQTVRHVHEVRLVEPPKPERLRVLYLAANPEQDLRVEVEVRSVKEAIKKALHRDLVEIDHRPAATTDDLLDGINELRPHVIHFSGHGGGGALLFDDAKIVRAEDDDVGRVVSFELLAKALAATDTPPTLVVLNACDSFEGADALLRVTPIIIGMKTGITDIGADAFAARFYSAVASEQSVQAAFDQGCFAMESLGFDEGATPGVVARDDVDTASVVLVREAEQSLYQRIRMVLDRINPEIVRRWDHGETSVAVMIADVNVRRLLDLSAEEGFDDVLSLEPTHSIAQRVGATIGGHLNDLDQLGTRHGYVVRFKGH